MQAGLSAVWQICPSVVFCCAFSAASSAHRPSCRPTSCIMQSPQAPGPMQAPTRPPRPPRCSQVPMYHGTVNTYVRTGTLVRTRHVYVPGTCTYVHVYRAHQVRFDGHIPVRSQGARCKYTRVRTYMQVRSKCVCSVGDSLCVGCGCLRFVGVVVFGMWCRPAM